MVRSEQADWCSERLVDVAWREKQVIVRRKEISGQNTNHKVEPMWRISWRDER